MTDVDVVHGFYWSQQFQTAGLILLLTTVGGPAAPPSTASPARSGDPGHGMTRRFAALAVSRHGPARGRLRTAADPAGAIRTTSWTSRASAGRASTCRARAASPARRATTIRCRRRATDHGRARGGPACRRPVRRPRGRLRRRSLAAEIDQTDPKRCGARSCRSTIRCATSPSPSRTRARVLWIDLEADVADGNEVYVATVEQLEGVARRRVRAGRGQRDLGRRGRADRPWASISGRARTSSQLAVSRGLDRPGHPRRHQRAHRRQRRRFELYRAFDQSAFVLALTDAERRPSKRAAGASSRSRTYDAPGVPGRSSARWRGYFLSRPSSCGLAGGRLRRGLRRGRPSRAVELGLVAPWRRLGGGLGLGRRRGLGRLGRGGRARVALAAAAAAAASARAVLLSAARALPAAVWAPLALPALPAAMRALAALAAAALPVVLTTRPPVWTCVPPSGGVDLAGQARLAARGGVRVDGAGLGRAIERAQRLGEGGHGVDRRSAGCAAAVRAFATNVFAALRRGWRTSWRLWA